MTITKAMTIAAEGVGEAGILTAGTNGVIVNAGPNDVVVLRGLQIDGGPVGSNSLAGVKFVAGAALQIQNSLIHNYNGSSPNGFGVNFAPNLGAGATASLLVTDTTITTNGVLNVSGGGIAIQPTGSGNVKASLTRVGLAHNTFGVKADGSGAAGGAISVSVSETVAADSSNSGFVVTGGGGGTVTMDIDHSTVANNGVGLNVSGTGATMRIGSSTVMGNATGVKITAPAAMTSYGNNQIDDNPVPGPTIPTNTNPLK